MLKAPHRGILFVVTYTGKMTIVEGLGYFPQNGDEAVYDRDHNRCSVYVRCR